MDRALRSHYQKTVSDWVTSKKLSILQRSFEKVIEGGEDPSVVVDDATVD